MSYYKNGWHQAKNSTLSKEIQNVIKNYLIELIMPFQKIKVLKRHY